MAEPQEQQAPDAAQDPFWGRMNDPTGAAHIVGICGDDMEIYLYVRDGIVEEVKYHSNGCENTRACGRETARRAQGRAVMDVLSISPREVIDALPELTEEGRHCAILAVSTLHRAVADYLLLP